MGLDSLAHEASSSPMFQCTSVLHMLTLVLNMFVLYQVLLS